MTYSNSLAQTGSGSTLSIGTTPVLIGEIKSSSINGASWATADVTNFNSGLNQDDSQQWRVQNCRQPSEQRPGPGGL
jgi:hypothetical protein